MFIPNRLAIKIFNLFNRGLTKLSIIKFQFLTKSGNNAFVKYPVYSYGEEYIKITGIMSSEPGLRIECIDKYEGQTFTPELLIGNNVSFNYRCHVGCINKIEIGDNVLIGSNVLITDHSHGNISPSELKISPRKRPLFSKGPVKIEDNVWIGENCVILPGVTVGKNSIIAASSVVTKSIPSNSLAAGNPAVVIRSLK